MTTHTATDITAPAWATLEGASLIGARDAHGTHGELRGRDPRTGEVLEPAYGLIGEAEVAEAAELAWAAFAGYRKTSPEQRARFLETIADNIDALGEALTQRVVTETGIARARVVGETARTVGQLRLFAAVLREGTWHGARIDPALPVREPLPRPDLRLRMVPLGPVAVFGASNFPLAFSVAGGDTASALAAGCPVIVKAHSSHPGTSELVGRAVRAAVAAHGLPEGVFSLVFGGGSSVGAALVAHPHINAVGFTGSRAGGTALAEIAATRPEPIPVYAEMSSINPVFVLPGALAARAAEIGAGWIGSVTTGVGQLCTSPGLLFVPAGANDGGADDGGAARLIDAAARAVRNASPSPMLSTAIGAAFEEAAGAVVGRPGVREIARGDSDPAIAVCGVARVFATDAETFLADEALQAEMFGPAAVVVTVTGIDQMHAVLERLEGQLTVTIHADGAEPGAAELLDAAALKAGRVIFNGWPTGVEVGHSMVHGGPFPATSQPRTTSVGSLAVERFLRPVSYQNVPAELQPEPVRDDNPLGIPRMIDGGIADEKAAGPRSDRP